MNRFALVTKGIIIVVGLALTSLAALADEPKEEGLHIAPQPLSTALREFSEQTGLQVGYASELAEGKSTDGVDGIDDPDLALDTLLAKSGLTHTFVNEQTVVIQAAEIATSDDAGGDRDPGNRAAAGATPIVMAQNQTVASQSQASKANERERETEREKRPIEEIVVTGTNIRGIAPESSPVRVYDRDDIQTSGAATAQDFIKTLPQNFGGGANPNIPSGLPDAAAAFNVGAGGSFGSGVNLRGLGSGGTLVLLNGRRLAPASAIGDFTDISMIPASAIERVETLSDGASSIYGSDAVAGVVNFILRDDFDGVETALRYGTGTENGTPSQYRASVTGGKTWDSGNALISYEFFDQDELSVEDRSFAQQDVLPNFLLPSQKRHSVLASAAQHLTPNLELFADFTYSDRGARQLRSELFDPDRIFEMNASSDSMTIAAGGAWNFGGNWVLEFSGTYSDLDTSNQLTSSVGTENLSVTGSSIETADAKFSGTLWRVPGGDIKLALGGHYRTESFLFTQSTTPLRGEAERNAYAVFGEAFVPIVGPENSVAGIERLELNLSARVSDYSDFDTTDNPKVGILWSPFDGLNIRGSYSTSFKAPPLGRSGASDLGAALTSMAEDNAALGLTPADPSIADATVLLVVGTDNNLDAEKSQAFTVGMDFDQQWGAHGLAFSTTWFDIDFEGRVGRPPIPGNRSFLDAPNIAFNDPGAFPEGTVIFSPTQDVINDIINNLDFPLFDQGRDPSDVTIINRVAISTNLARTAVSGFDFDASYTYDLNRGSLLFRLDGTFLADFQQQGSPASPVVEQVNTLFNPVDLKLRGRAGYSNANFSSNVFVNFVDDYHVDSTANAALIDAWTTVDINLSYDTKERFGDSVLDNTIFRLSVINLFDNDPPQAPITATLRVDGYDPTNASPLGRFVAFEVNKRF